MFPPQIEINLKKNPTYNRNGETENEENLVLIFFLEISEQLNGIVI